MKAYLAFLTIGLLLLVAATRAAAQSLVVAPYPVSEVVFQEEQRVPEYPFVAATLSTLRGQVQADNLYSLRGLLLRETREIPGMHSEDEVMEHYVSVLKELGAQILFRCEARNCGRSNDWANVIYKRSTLYGPDRDQRYMAAVLPRAGSAPLAISVYVIRRGNQRLYAHVEQVAAESGLGAVISSVENQRELHFSSDLLDSIRELEERLGDWLTLAQELKEPYRVYIVSYYRGAELGADANLVKARQQAESLKAWLTQRRIDESVIEIVIVGPWGADSMYAHSPGSFGLFLDPEPSGE